MTYYDIKGVSQEGWMKITGRLQNNWDATLKTVTVRFSVFDEAGSKIGEALDYISTLDPGQSWSFEASSKAGSFRLDGVWCSHGQLSVENGDQARRIVAEKERVSRQEAAALARSNAVLRATQQRQQKLLSVAEANFKFRMQRARMGDGDSQLRVAEFYLKGEGTERDDLAARRWLEAAVTNGVSSASRMLGQMDKQTGKSP
jgi:TPR repeat protein